MEEICSNRGREIPKKIRSETLTYDIWNNSLTKDVAMNIDDWGVKNSYTLSSGIKVSDDYVDDTSPIVLLFLLSLIHFSLL